MNVKVSSSSHALWKWRKLILGEDQQKEYKSPKEEEEEDDDEFEDNELDFILSLLLLDIDNVV